MNTASVEKARTGSVTIKLDAVGSSRIEYLATAKKRTPHYLMKEAILDYVKTTSKKKKRGKKTYRRRPVFV